MSLPCIIHFNRLLKHLILLVSNFLNILEQSYAKITWNTFLLSKYIGDSQINFHMSFIV